MAAVPVTLVGTIFTPSGPVPSTFIGQAFVTGLGVGGGPMPGGQPPPLGIWGGGGVGDYIDAGFPGPQPGGPTHIWGGGGVGDYIDAGFPGPQPRPPGSRPPPIISVPPNTPNLPPTGSPPVILGGTHPMQPITPPPAVIIEYPGIGRIVVPMPTETLPAPSEG